MTLNGMFKSQRTKAIEPTDVGVSFGPRYSGLHFVPVSPKADQALTIADAGMVVYYSF